MTCEGDILAQEALYFRLISEMMEVDRLHRATPRWRWIRRSGLLTEVRTLRRMVLTEGETLVRMRKEAAAS